MKFRSEEDGGNERMNGCKRMNGCIRKFDIVRFFQYIKMYIERWVTKKELQEELETVIATLLREIPKMDDGERWLKYAYINPQVSTDLCRLLTQIPPNAESELINNQGYPCTIVTFPTESGMREICFTWLLRKSPEEQRTALSITTYTHNSFLVTDSENGAEIGFSETFGFNPISHYHSFMIVNQNESVDQQENIESLHYPYYDDIDLELYAKGGK